MTRAGSVSYAPHALSTRNFRARRQVALLGGACRATGRVSLGPAEATAISVFSQRLAYGITPENEHHLVAQRDVRQFQVGAAQSV